MFSYANNTSALFLIASFSLQAFAYVAPGSAPYTSQTVMPSYNNNSAPHHTVAPAPPPEHLAVGDQFYDATTDGMRDYLETIKLTSPQVYSELDLDLKSITSKQKTASIVMWSSIGVGAVLAIVPLLKPKTTKEDIGDSTTGPLIVDKTTYNWSMAYVGLGIMVLGPVVAMVISPNRKDFLNFNKDIRPTIPTAAVASSILRLF